MERSEIGRTFGLDSSDAGIRELIAVREITQAFLTAKRPGDVYQFALDKVSPLVGAAFACVYLIDGDSDIMRLQAVHNWPVRYAAFLGEMRVRLGSGPSGTAASERRAIEVADVFADPALQDWQEVATELGFKSIVALPLQTGEIVLGAVTFYFAKAGSVSPDGRGLLRVVAGHLAAAAEKARLIEDLSRTNGALHQTNAELEKQYLALLEARRLQDEFLSNVSHELRTPLTAVLGYLSVMEEGLAGPMTTEQLDTLAQVKGSSEKLLGLITDLLDLAALKRGDMKVQVTEFDPRDALRDAIKRASSRHDAIPLHVTDTAVLPMISTDKAKLTRLLSALLGNAFKFTERGEIHVSVASVGNRMIFRVADTGIGISSEAQDFVFDEFRQEDGSPTRRYGGSGLGLAIARRLARTLGGDVSMSSERGKGSTFKVELPVVYDAG